MVNIFLLKISVYSFLKAEESEEKINSNNPIAQVTPVNIKKKKKSTRLKSSNGRRLRNEDTVSAGLPA